MATNADAAVWTDAAPITVLLASTAEIPSLEAGRDDDFWEGLRQQFTVGGGVAYLDNAAYAPPPGLVLEAQERWQHQLSANPANPMRLGELEPIRAHIAEVIGATEDEITLTRSATEGFSLLLYGFDWHRGDEILYDGGDHPNIVGILETLRARYGVRLVDAGLDDECRDDAGILARYAAGLTAATRLLLLPHVNGRTGRRLPVRALADLAHANGTLVALDASQSFGVLQFSVRDLGVDFAAAPGHKWASAGHGGGFAYYRHDAQRIIWPTVGGGYDPKSTSVFDQSARRLDRNAGQKNIPFLLGFGTAIAWHNAVGRGAIEARVLALSAYAREALATLPTVNLLGDAGVAKTAASAADSPLTVFTLDGHSARDVQERLLRQENVRLGAVGEGDTARLRLSPHIHNSLNDIDRAIWALARLTAA